MTTTSRTAVIRTPGGPDAVEIVELPVPEPGPGEIQVRIAAAAVNPVDVGVVTGVFHAMGLIHQPDHTGIGWDFAGTVTAAGTGAEVAVGSRVAGFVPGFDRPTGTFAEHVVVPAGDVALVPAGLDLVAASTVPLNGSAAAQLVDLLGDPPHDRAQLLVTGAAGAVGADVVLLARDRGWLVTGLARPTDEEFVRSLGADFTARLQPGWDAVVDGAALKDRGLALVRDGGTFVGVQPSAEPPAERGIAVRTVVTQPDRDRLTELLARTASGALPARVHAVVPLAEAAEALRAVAEGGIRGRYVITP